METSNSFLGLLISVVIITTMLSTGKSEMLVEKASILPRIETMAAKLDQMSLEDILGNDKRPLTLEVVREQLDDLKLRKFSNEADRIPEAISNLYALTDPKSSCEVIKLRNAIKSRPISMINFNRLVKFVVKTRLPECVDKVVSDMSRISKSINMKRFENVDKLIYILDAMENNDLIKSTDRIRFDRLLDSEIYDEALTQLYEELKPPRPRYQEVLRLNKSQQRKKIIVILDRVCQDLISLSPMLITNTEQLIELSTIDQKSVELDEDVSMLFYRARLCYSIVSNQRK